MIKRSSIVRRGNRRGGVFIDAEDANKWIKHAWYVYFFLLRSAREACAMYKKHGNEFYKRIALSRMKNVRECLELCRAIAGARKVYREERP